MKLFKVLALSFALVWGSAQAQNISIATGGTGGVYYPMGGGLASVLSKKVPGMSATAEVTGGSVDNLNLIGTGKPYVVSRWPMPLKMRKPDKASSQVKKLISALYSCFIQTVCTS